MKERENIVCVCHVYIYIYGPIEIYDIVVRNSRCNIKYCLHIYFYIFSSEEADPYPVL